MLTIKELKAQDGDLLENALKELAKYHRNVVLSWDGLIWRCSVGKAWVEAFHPAITVFGHILSADPNVKWNEP